MKKIILSALLTLSGTTLFGQSVVKMPVLQNPLFEVSTDRVDVIVPESATEYQLGGDLVITGGSGNYTYYWTDADGRELGSESVLSVSTPGLYILTVSDTCDCSHTIGFHVETSGVKEIADTAGFKPVRIAVVDMAGRMVALFTAPEGLSLGDPDLSAIPSGIYILTLTDASGHSVSSRIIR